jgi:hypothetical protein
LERIAQASPDGRIRIEYDESINPDGSLSEPLIIKFGPGHKLEQPVKATALGIKLTSGVSNTKYSVDAGNWREAFRLAAEQLSNKK